jgi:hypothetical protein
MLALSKPKMLGILKGSRELEEEGRYQGETKGTLTQDGQQKRLLMSQRWKRHKQGIS